MNAKKVQRVRSPNYPNYSLKECMDFLNKLYGKYGTGEVHVDDAISQMGHSPTSSTANRVVASMLSFGLIESRGTKDNKFVRLSRLAQEILLENEDSPQRFELLQQAALKDNSMQSVWEKWENKIPAEETIKKVLQLEMNYSIEGAKRFASVVVETYHYAQLDQQAIEEPDEEIVEQDEQPSGYAKSKNEEEKLHSSSRKANLLLPGSNREIVIYAPDDLTSKEFELIFKWLELQKYGLVTEEKDDEKQG